MIAEIITQTISGIIINLPWFILIVWGVKTISKEMPTWLRVLHENQIREIALQKAINMNK